MAEAKLKKKNVFTRKIGLEISGRS